MTTPFQFQSAKAVSGKRGLQAAVEETMKQFQTVAAENLRRGGGSVVTTVTEPEQGCYFAVVIAGPFSDLTVLQSALSEATTTDMLDQLKRVGLD